MLTQALASSAGGVVFVLMAALLAYRVIAASIGATSTSLWRMTTRLRVPLLALTAVIGAAHWLLHG